jgi:hypothetical protein
VPVPFDSHEARFSPLAGRVHSPRSDRRHAGRGARCSAGIGHAGAAVQRPNILFILVDDMGFADLSVMGNRKVQTPNLDKLARTAC